jgi:signal transduction histidine kinase
MRLRREPVDMPAVVQAAVDLMRPLTLQRKQQVALDLPTSDRMLLGDPRRLSQVAVNLLANANKFAPDESTIRVELVWGEETVSLWVEDEGPGLPPLARRSDLFAPFRRAPGEDPSQRGTGLGLTIVRALVERHHGEVVVAVSKHGKGARLGVVLPLEPRT